MSLSLNWNKYHCIMACDSLGFQFMNAGSNFKLSSSDRLRDDQARSQPRPCWGGGDGGGRRWRRRPKPQGSGQKKLRRRSARCKSWSKSWWRNRAGRGEQGEVKKNTILHEPKLYFIIWVRILGIHVSSPNCNIGSLMGHKHYRCSFKMCSCFPAPGCVSLMPEVCGCCDEPV